MLEAFVRISYRALPSGRDVGPFLNLCEQPVDTAEEVLDEDDTGELRDLLEYANHFHHDTNPAYETVRINDAELRGFVARTLTFTRR